MSDPGSHIIKKTSVRFQFNGNADAMKLQQDVADWARIELATAIDSVLSEFDSTDDTIAIDYLSLDIDLEGVADWKSGLGDQIRRQLKEKLHHKIASKDKDITIKSRSESFAEILAYYLKFGILPWNSSVKSGGDFKAGLDSWIGLASSAEIKKLMLMLEDSRSFSRLSAVLTRRGIERIIAVFSRVSADQVALLLKEVDIIMKELTGDKELKEKFFRDFTAIHLRETVARYPESMLYLVFKEWLGKIEMELPGRVAAINVSLLRLPEIVSIVRKLQKEVISNSILSEEKITELPESPVDKVPVKKVKLSDELLKELKNGTFISNAGIVIIAPFFPVMFSRSGILNDDTITDPSMALAVMNYCISGNKTAVEFDMLLPKILCGLPVSEIYEMTALKDERIIKEADEMLSSVIEYWSALKDTSAGGLREGFLQRNGKLVYNQDEWHLIVGQKPYDMLLEKLPWNISLIRLPWMTTILRTQWI